MNTLEKRLLRRSRIAVGIAHGKTGSGRAIREKAGLRQREVAAILGVDQGAVSKWERGLHPPSDDNAVAWADLLDRIRGTAEPTESPA
ncbi:XRE family transcriptional regulator [Micromonospora fluostatini]|uniref:XRE family transcriptional regulator n=1 Tax=Micromonospora fluostatini TaxID=1629071 RepID=A0ABY2DJ33_9ACTN|nr:XRE family transcriptional regulator [Micromonospora fluostatini]